MKQSIETAFPQTIDGFCLEEIKAAEFWVFDESETKRCYVKVEPTADEKHFQVLNPSTKSISFLAIDKCLFDDSIKNQKRCDFAVFDDSVFCFVEIKVVKAKNRKSERVEMYKQLKMTIRTFNDNQVSFANRKIEAVVCFPIFDPILQESKIYPAFSSRSTDTTSEFLQDYNATLLEGNSKTFL
jgi:hypothetical protein